MPGCSIRWSAIFLASLVLFTSPAKSGVLYVDTRAAGVGDGHTWADAFTDLQSALAAAKAAGGGVSEIWVAEGIYRPDRDATHPTGTGDRNATFQLISGVAFRGGFAGNENPATFDLATRDFATHPTILSGDLAGNDGPNFANNADNCYHVLTANGVDSTAALDGFTVSGGIAWIDPLSLDLNSGGGLYCVDSSPIITFCIFRGNCAGNPSQSGNKGGAVCCYRSSPTLSHCTFSGNKANYGAGMAIYDTSAPHLSDCLFTANIATGFYSYYGCQPVLTRCWFEQHTGSGMHSFGQAQLDHCTFTQNTCVYGGGGYWGEGRLLNCTLTQNSSSYSGGGVQGNATLINCVIDSNNAGWDGGGVRLDGQATMVNCTIVNNTAKYGAGVYIYPGGTASISNCILWNNQDQNGTSETAQVFGDGAQLRYCLVQGWTGSLGGAGNLGNLLRHKPWFKDAPGGDFSLRPGSACIDAGDTDAIKAAAATFDVAGLPRVVDDLNVPNTGTGSPTVDIGAYEAQADCNRNGTEDSTDIADGISQDCNANGYPDECEPAKDCDGNGASDICDIATGQGEDCNSNLTLDSCDISTGTSQDCNGNDVPDGCDLEANPSQDCNGNDVPDECDVNSGTSRDLNTNGIPDECEPDCNRNIVPDDRDIATGASPDGNSNRVPDECEATVLYVNAGSTGQDFGLSWVNAYKQLHTALTVAQNRANAVSEIWVAAGTYLPDTSRVSAPREATFRLVSGVAVYGGFQGGESSLDQRNPAVNRTVLSGDLGRNDLSGFRNYTENVLHVVDGSGVDSSAVLDGFTITGGYAANAMGGGVYVKSGSPTIQNCLFVRNYAQSGGGASVSGNARIIHSVFAGNRAIASGGGLSTGQGSPTVLNCLFSGNEVLGGASGRGGGLYAGSAGYTELVSVINCTVTGNRAGYTGGVYDYESQMLLVNCVLWGNTDQSTYTNSEAEQLRYYSYQPQVTSSCIQGYSGAVVGNIGADPLFADADGPDGVVGTEDDNARLQPGSPCIDAGSNAAVPAGVTTDLDGRARFADDPCVSDCATAPGSCGTAPIVDMGAYEYSPRPAVDLNHDGTVSAADFDRFLAAFGHGGCDAGYNAEADFDGDGVVSLVDYQQWLQQYRAAVGNPQAPAPLEVLGDFQRDGYVDEVDLDHIMACQTGAMVPQDNPECHDADLDGDSDVDQDDFGSFQKCITGTGGLDLGCKY